MIERIGVFDRLTGEVYPADTGSWSQLTDSDWDSWNTWYLNPTLPIRWGLEPDQYVGSDVYNLKLETDAVGQVSYEVYTSSTGEWGTDETVTVINSDDQNIPGFFGRHYLVLVVVDATGPQVPRLSNVVITATNRPISESLTDVQTSTLSGSITSRQLRIRRKYSIISNIDVQVQEVEPYDLDLYVSNYPTSTTVIPRVVSMDRSAPTIALLGIDGSNQDGLVSVTVTGLPEQYMSGNNLYIR